MAIDAGARVPTAVLSVIVYPNRHDILPAFSQERSYVVRKPRVAIRMMPKLMAVDPDIGVHVNAVEEQRDTTVFI